MKKYKFFFQEITSVLSEKDINTDDEIAGFLRLRGYNAKQLPSQNGMVWVKDIEGNLWFVLSKTLVCRLANEQRGLVLQRRNKKLDNHQTIC